MNSRFILLALLFVTLSLRVSAGDEPVTVAPPVNVVFLLVDDLGWTDLACFGSSFYETPQVDRLASRGMRFTQAYAACPVCSPTRASILTGRHPVRVGITDWIPGFPAERHPNPRFLHVDDRDNLALEEVTLAELFREAGYRTFFAGKWHLGDRGHWPTDQGFDVNVGGNAFGSPPGGYYGPWTNPTLTARSDGEYLTERLTEESLAFLDDHGREGPFVLYLSYYNVHTPITPYKKRVEHYRQKAAAIDGPTPQQPERDGVSRRRQDDAAYASMVAAVDDSVGQILDRLDQLELAERTVICFFSDNGGLCTSPRIGPTSNLPLRSGKGWLYEGGIREPMIIVAPGVAQPGSTCDVPVVSMDFLPTLLELAGLPSRPDLHVDGVSLLPLLQGLPMPADRQFYWHYPHYHGSTWTPGAAVRDGDWKLIEFYHWQQVELYNLRDDPGEQTDLSAQDPERTQALRDQLRGWQQQMNATMPQPNPAFDSQ